MDSRWWWWWWTLTYLYSVYECQLENDNGALENQNQKPKLKSYHHGDELLLLLWKYNKIMKIKIRNIIE